MKGCGMPKRDFLAGVIALSQENPKRFLSLMREGWPEIKAAIDQGHTLKVIHQRLVEGGVKMTYRCFTTYVRRFRNESASRGMGIRPLAPVIAGTTEKMEDPPDIPSNAIGSEVLSAESQSDNNPDAPTDPYETIREHLNRTPRGFHWEEDVPDASKLY